MLNIARTGTPAITHVTVNAPNLKLRRTISAIVAKRLWKVWGALEQAEVERALTEMPTNVFVRRRDSGTHMTSGAMRLQGKEVRITLSRLQRLDRELYKVTASFTDIVSGKTRRHKATVTIPKKLSEIVIPATAIPRGSVN